MRATVKDSIITTYQNVDGRLSMGLVYTIETNDPVFGWQTEQTGFNTLAEAEHAAKRDVLPFWPIDRVRIVEDNEAVKDLKR